MPRTAKPRDLAVAAYLAEIGRASTVGVLRHFRHSAELLHPDASETELDEMAENARQAHLRANWAKSAAVRRARKTATNA